MRFTVETSAFAEATKRAGRVAPSKGAAFDKAAGFLIATGNGSISISATDIETTYFEEIPTQGLVEAGSVRLPSSVVTLLASQLEPDSMMTFQVDGSEAVITCGSTDARVRTLDASSFPTHVGPIHEVLSEVDGFGEAVNRVSGFASKDDRPPVDGIHFTGTHAIATNLYSLAMTPLAFPVEQPITVPLSLIAPLLRDDSVGVGATEKRLLMRTSTSQITTAIYNQPFPDMSRINEVAEKNKQRFKIRKSELATVLNRMAVMARGERMFKVKVEIGSHSKMHVSANVSGLGDISDEIHMLSLRGTDDPTISCNFQPQFLFAALNGVDDEFIECGHNNDPDKPWSFSGPDFEAVVMTVRTT